MIVNDTEVLLCNCGKTMPLDAKKIASGCNSVDEPIIYNSLCTNQFEAIEKSFEKANSDGKNFAIACTQQAKQFSDYAEETNQELPHLFNIRENAGWSETSEYASAKIASLISDATNIMSSNQISRSISFNSLGRCLIYGESSSVLEISEVLSEFLGVTAMLSDSEDVSPPKISNFTIAKGNITNLIGHFGSFKVSIDNFSESLPNSKEKLIFENPSNGVSSECDIFIDLSNDLPLVKSHEKRDGYYKINPQDKIACKNIIIEAQSKIGEFEKPIYVKFDENLCAHSRNKIDGCNKCLDACPAGAITPNGDTVSIDSAICGGCGMCGSVCPSGAAQVIWPSTDNLLNRLSVIVDTYNKIEKKMPRLLLHDEEHGSNLISYSARNFAGLPNDVIPIQLHSMGRVGHDILIGATAMGFSNIYILTDPKKHNENIILEKEIEISEALLKGISIDNKHQMKIIEINDPEDLQNHLNKDNNQKYFKSSPFAAIGASRSMVRTAMLGLAKENNTEIEIINLPANSPYGSVDIDKNGCTLCLSCVSVCPAGALQDNPEMPQLLFREDACIQCGLCVKTCPEKVISLNPQFNLDDSALSNQLINEDEPFECIKCDKVFGTKKSITAIKKRLSSHSMFISEERQNLILMCEDCRVEEQFSQNDKIMDVGERPKPRTTDDYK